MKSIHRWSVSLAVVAVIALGSPPIARLASPASVNGNGDLGNKIAGTYLAVEEDGSQVLQIGRDGNLSLVLSIQFTGGGVLGESFSVTLGSWKTTGKREVSARTVDLTFQSGNFFGVAAATVVITFDETFETATATSEGAIFPPGVNPFNAGAEPIAGSGFSSRFEFHRIPVEGKNGNHP